MRILLVEDEFVIAASLKFLLETFGHVVVGIADDVVSAVNKSECTHPQLAFVDIQLAHGASGLDVAAELRKRGVICIFLTGNLPQEPRPDLALGCLPKPFPDNSLEGAIRIAEAVIQGLPPPTAPIGFGIYRL